MPTWWGKKKNNRNAELNRSILKDLNILKNNYAKKRTIRKTITLCSPLSCQPLEKTESSEPSRSYSFKHSIGELESEI